MNGIWVPIAATLIIGACTVIDLWDENEVLSLRGEPSSWAKFKEEWVLACLALAVKPGLILFAIWAIWLKVML